MKFYTIKLPKFLGGLVKAMLGTLKKWKSASLEINDIINKEKPAGNQPVFW